MLSDMEEVTGSCVLSQFCAHQPFYQWKTLQTDSHFKDGFMFELLLFVICIGFCWGISFQSVYMKSV